MKTTWVDVWGQGVLVGGLTSENVRKPQALGFSMEPYPKEKKPCVFQVPGSGGESGF